MILYWTIKKENLFGFLAIQYNRIGGVDFTEEEKNEILRLKFFIEDRLEKLK